MGSACFTRKSRCRPCAPLVAHLELAESFVLALAQSTERRLGRFFVEEGLLPAAFELIFQSLDPLVCPRTSTISIVWDTYIFTNTL